MVTNLSGVTRDKIVFTLSNKGSIVHVLSISNMGMIYLAATVLLLLGLV
jgi:hypothetical protein